MFPHSTANSPKTNSQLQNFVQQQNQHKKGPNVNEKAKKQNLISQLQSNQQKSMLYRLH